MDENGEDVTTIDTNVNVVLKSETWINGYCSGSCISNCTGNQGGGPVFEFIRKSIDPVKEDIRVEDPSIRFMCKSKSHFLFIKFGA